MGSTIWASVWAKQIMNFGVKIRVAFVTCVALSPPPNVSAQKPGFASKTSYLAISKDANNSLALPPSCSVGSLWLLARHGTRNPGSKDKQKMETLLPRLRDKIVA